MSRLESCFAGNRAWVTEVGRSDPGMFARLTARHAPEILWIGCADARLPPDRIIGKPPGSVFVHRNVGNVVVHSDMNLASVLGFGVGALGIRDVVVCGHYGCGAVRAVEEQKSWGVVDHWLLHIQDVLMSSLRELAEVEPGEARHRRLCELHVMAQVRNVARSPALVDAWRSGADVAVHGWIYALDDGRTRDLDVTVAGPPRKRGP